MAIGIMTNTTISLGDMSMIMDYLDNEAYLDAPDEDRNTLEITKTAAGRKIVKPKLSDDALINKFSLVRTEHKMKQEDNVLDNDLTVLDGADDIDFSFDDFDNIGAKKENKNNKEAEESDDIEIEGLDEEIENSEEDEITDDDLESMMNEEDTEQEDMQDIDLENAAILIQQQLANKASSSEESDDMEIEGLEEIEDNDDDEDDIEIEGLEDIEDDDDEDDIDNTEKAIVNQANKVSNIEQKEDSTKSNDDNDFEIEGLEDLEDDDQTESDEITDNDLESIMDDEDDISEEKDKNEDNMFDMSDLNELLADEEDNTEDRDVDIDEIGIDAIQDDGDADEEDDGDADEENDMIIADKNSTHYVNESTNNNIVDSTTKQLEEQIKEKEKQNELLLKLQALEEENKRLRANANSKENKTQLNSIVQDKINETQVKKEGKQDDIIDNAIKSQNRGIKNEIKGSPYDKYTVMNIDSLYKTVKKYMIDKGVKQRAIDIADLNSKFGADNIKKLIVKQYLIKTKKGVTVGL